LTCDATGLIYRDRLNLHRQTWFKRLRHVDDGIRGVLSLEHLLEDTVDLIAVLCTALYIDHESGQLDHTVEGPPLCLHGRFDAPQCFPQLGWETLRARQNCRWPCSQR